VTPICDEKEKNVEECKREDERMTRKSD